MEFPVRSNLAINPGLNASVDPLPVKYITRLDCLDRLRSESADAVLFDRKVPQSVTTWIDEIPADQLPEGRYRLMPNQVEGCVRDAFIARGVVPCPSLQWLCEDVHALALNVGELLQASTLRLRLEPVSTNACSKFHIDTVEARLICTYRGPATQYCVVPEKAESVATGMPIVLKGRLWDQAEALTLKHRSPPISGSGITRWMIVIEGASTDDGLAQYDEPYPPQN